MGWAQKIRERGASGVRRRESPLWNAAAELRRAAACAAAYQSGSWRYRTPNRRA